MIQRMLQQRRRGSIVPLVAVSMVALVGCVALAVDIGLFAEARTQMQDAVDAAVLVGVRQFDTQNAGSAAIAQTVANQIALSNKVVGVTMTGANVTNFQMGVYHYDKTQTPAQFVTQWGPPAANSGDNYGAMTMTIQYNQPTIFGRVFGVTQQQITTSATAVYRPRDIAIVLDFSGSMSNGSQASNMWDMNNAGTLSAGNVRSNNVDPNFPQLGPWSLFSPDDPNTPTAPTNPMNITQGISDGTYTYNPSNITYPTARHSGPIAHDFATLTGGDYNRAAWAFNIPGFPNPPDVPLPRLNPSGSAPPTTGVAPTPATYLPLDTTNPTVMPAPVEICNQNVANWQYSLNANGIWESVYGDKFPYKVAVGSLPGGNGQPLPANYATSAHDYLSALNTTNMTNVQTGLPVGTKPVAIGSDTDARPTTAGNWWEYGTAGVGGVPVVPTSTPAATQAAKDAFNRANNGGYSLNSALVGNDPAISFAGYTMGPYYYGKTFYMWPPDPRQPSNNATIASPAAGESPATAWARGYRPGDWRLRFFTSNATTLGNSTLWNTGNKHWKTPPPINYTNVLAWIKSGPQVFPPNLISGRIKYYNAIPDTITGNGGTDDERFWKNYIDWVLAGGRYTNEWQYLYGYNTSATWGSNTYGTLQIQGLPGSNVLPLVGSPQTTYQASMNYSDMPIHPRAHFWFGPVSMLAFLQPYTGGQPNQWGLMPGTCKESQSWELKTAVMAALDDIKKNHPNDWTAMIFFSSIGNFATPRQALTNDYDATKLFLWYPFSIGGQTPKQYLSNNATLLYPIWDSSFNAIHQADGVIPTANGGTCYEMGMQVAFNQFSANASAPGGGPGRNGANKLVIFETDGVPNTQCSGNWNPVSQGQSYYNGGIGSTGGGDYSGTQAQAVVTNMTSTNGWSNRAKVHCIAFGDLLESTAPPGPQATALGILGAIQGSGGTQNPLESYKIITGNFDTRITNLTNAFQRVMQSDVQIALIQ